MKNNQVTDERSKMDSILLDFYDRWDMFIEIGAGGLGLYLSTQSINLESDPEAKDFISNFIEKRKTEGGKKAMRSFLKKRLNIK